MYQVLCPGRGFFMERFKKVVSIFTGTNFISLKSNLLTMIHAELLGVLGTNEIIIILIIVLLLFGGRKIPELMRGLGKGVREFNDAKTNVKREIEESANDIKTP